MAVNQAALRDACRAVLVAIGEDPDRDGLRDTPARWAKWWSEFIEGDGEVSPTSFESGADQVVVVGPMRVWSLCEHHLLPFWCDVWVGYIPAGRLLGLSKFGRISRACASRLQVQEVLTQQIADAVSEATGSNDVAVLGKGEHSCMIMRGARMPTQMSTSVTRGRFRGSPEVLAEFMRVVALHA